MPKFNSQFIEEDNNNAVVDGSRHSFSGKRMQKASSYKQIVNVTQKNFDRWRVLTIAFKEGDCKISEMRISPRSSIPNFFETFIAHDCL